jgi:hypothetical protein
MFIYGLIRLSDRFSQIKHQDFVQAFHFHPILSIFSQNSSTNLLETFRNANTLLLIAFEQQGFLIFLLVSAGTKVK